MEFYYIPNPIDSLTWVPLKPEQIIEFENVKPTLDTCNSRASMGHKRYGQIMSDKYIFLIDTIPEHGHSKYYIKLADRYYEIIALPLPYNSLMELPQNVIDTQITQLTIDSNICSMSGGFYKKKNTRSKKRKSSRKRQ